MNYNLETHETWIQIQRNGMMTTVMLLLISCYVYTICKYRRDGDGDGDGDGDAEGCFIPAAGVMQTRPVVMPCTAPMTDGLPKMRTSRAAHTRRLVAVHTWVLSTANEESMSAEKPLPPLKPAQPNQSRPAPTNVNKMLLGGNRSRSFVNRGPTYNTLIPNNLTFFFFLHIV